MDGPASGEASELGEESTSGEAFESGDPHRARFEANREHWESMVEPVSATDGTAEIESFLAGESALLPVQREELGDVDGARLLDLQCSIGTRTLSWAREGATVTGADISAESVRVARELADEAGLADRAEFVRSNVYDLPDGHDRRYDTVVTNFGVLCWLPDLDRWAAVAAELLEPGGTFYLAEHHPIATALSDDLGTGGEPLSVEHPYFSTDDPVTAPDGSTHKWPHGLGEILTALADAGIRIRFVHEYPFSPIRRSSEMVQDDRGRWRFEGDRDLPLLVTVKGELRSDAPGV
ncbi:class I SAM-dependent methyltransferase [Halobaculum halobium]|uniref:Class I SAM-dependent methyltransferase n=1 Tax=Halobaculum halobium TaxID=3032281 RepID=A0ABD5TBA3_9EURY|nr:class I SAM-dependent methyltransferase [Halobaculum sp. SYNS20]